MTNALVLTTPGVITNPSGPVFEPGLVNPGATRITPNTVSLLTAGGGGTMPTVVNDATYGRAIRFDGSTNRASLHASAQAYTAATLIMVARLPRTPGGFDNVATFVSSGVGGKYFNRRPDGTLYLYAGTALNLPSVVVDTAPHVFVAVINGADSVVGVDGTEATGTIGSGATDNLSFGTNPGDSNPWATIDVIDAAWWEGTALTAPQRAAEVTNLKHQHGIA